MLKGINIDVSKNKVIALVGPSGINFYSFNAIKVAENQASFQ